MASVARSLLKEGHNVFITGGGSGINLGIGLAYARLGANVAICGRRQDRLDAAVASLSAEGAGIAFGKAADVRDADAMKTSMEAAAEAWGGPADTVVAGAAGNFLCPAKDMTPNGFKTVIDIDLVGAFNTAHAAFPQLSQTGGNLQFISAGQASVPHSFQLHAGAAKAGIENMMRNLALEWGRYGIRANAIVPGPIEGTEGVDRLLGAGLHDRFAATIPLGTYGTVDDVANASIFLASYMARIVTGVALTVDGGQNLPGTGLMTELLLSKDGPLGKAE